MFRKNSRCRRLSIRVHPVRGISVSFPYAVPYAAAMAFFRLRRQWVLETVMKQKQKSQDIHVATAEEVEQMRARAKAELPVRLAELAERYGFTYNRVAIKHNSTNWGSCSTKSNINLNLNIVRLPYVLRDYILTLTNPNITSFNEYSAHCIISCGTSVSSTNTITLPAMCGTAQTIQYSKTSIIELDIIAYPESSNGAQINYLCSWQYHRL